MGSCVLCGREHHIIQVYRRTRPTPRAALDQSGLSGLHQGTTQICRVASESSWLGLCRPHSRIWGHQHHWYIKMTSVKHEDRYWYKQTWKPHFPAACRHCRLYCLNFGGGGDLCRAGFDVCVFYSFVWIVLLSCLTCKCFKPFWVDLSPWLLFQNSPNNTTDRRPADISTPAIMFFSLLKFDTSWRGLLKQPHFMLYQWTVHAVPVNSTPYPYRKWFQWSSTIISTSPTTP